MPLSVSYLSLWLLWFGFLGEFIVPGYSAKEYSDPGLKLHNEYRQNHQVDALVLGDELNEKADKCAQYYIDKGTIDHTCPYKGKVGENLYWRGGTDLDATAAVKEAVKRWYDEIEDYDFSKNDAKAGKGFGNIGHFTQVVWKGSKKLGVGYAAKEGAAICVVGLYDPPGNYQGMYGENVLKPLKGPGSGERSTSILYNSLVNWMGIIFLGWLLRPLGH